MQREEVGETLNGHNITLYNMDINCFSVAVTVDLATGLPVSSGSPVGAGNMDGTK
jgi:hypothetical protein